MNLIEYHAKRLFGQHGIPVPAGELAYTPEEARTIAERLGGGTVVVKAQVLTGGRGKAGGVKLAHNPDEAEARARDILGLDIKGFTVHKVLVDPGVVIQDEIYLAILLDRAARRPMIMASAAGGMDIEAVAEETPEKIIKVHINPQIGVRTFHSTYIASRMALPQELWGQFHNIVTNLYDCFISNDASLTEINPLIIDGDGNLMAVDGKMTIDDNGLARHPELAELREADAETASEREARKHGINFIQLDGNIGCMVNGAGLAMTSMDVIKLFGGSPANFLDIGGGAKAEQVTAALRLILSDKNVEAVLINIFGGITRGDEVARGIIAALDQVDTKVPFVVRLAGTNAAEGRAILADQNMTTAVTLSEAAQKAIAAAKGRGV